LVGSILIGLAFAQTALANLGQAVSESSLVTFAAVDEDAVAPGLSAVAGTTGNTPPSVILIYPFAGITFVGPLNLALRAQAVDDDGSIKQVEFLVGSDSLGKLTSIGANGTYELIWTNAPPGRYVLTAKATDNLGATTASAPLEFSIVPSTGAELLHGYLRREVFLEVPGITLADLTNHAKFPNRPDSVDLVSQFEAPTNIAENYGTRLSGYLLPPVTGDYLFYIASDDQGALFLSSDSNPANKVQIATEPFWSMPRQWTDTPYDSQKQSAAIHLAAGQKYYVEALMKEGGGGDCLSVAWQLPGARPPTNGAPPISGQYLATYMVNQATNRPPTVSLISPTNGAIFLSSTNIMLHAEASDADGEVKQVDLYAGDRLLKSDTHSPFRVNWTNVPPGNHVLIAKATDNSGLSTTSAPVHITVIEFVSRAIVNVVATDPSATEKNTRDLPDTATFLIARTGPTNFDLPVYYSLSGTASNGVDYVRLADMVLITKGCAGT
jgi:hypothetical protein